MTDGTYVNGMAVLWTSLESTLGIICACIVVMRPLFGKAFPDRLKIGEKTNQLSSDPSTSLGSRLSRTGGAMPPKRHPRAPSGIGAESHDRIGSGVFQRLGDDIFPLSPGSGQTKATNTTTIEVGTGDGEGSGVVDVETRYPNQCLSPGFIMVKREWEVDSLMV